MTTPPQETDCAARVDAAESAISSHVSTLEGRIAELEQREAFRNSFALSASANVRAPLPHLACDRCGAMHWDLSLHESAHWCNADGGASGVEGVMRLVMHPAAIAEQSE